MQTNPQDPAILRKSYEISYAVFRVASAINNPSLKERLEGQAFALIDAAAVQNYGALSLFSRSVEYLIRFGGDMGIVNLANAETIIVQLNALNVAIAESGNAATATPSEVKLDGIFAESMEPEKSVGPMESYIPKYEPVEYPHAAIESVNIEKSNNEANPNAAIRQTAILERIRQSGNCRLKDLQEVLPGTSERTIRYDLQSLVEQNLVERIGNGGPSVYYRVRQMA